MKYFYTAIIILMCFQGVCLSQSKAKGQGKISGMVLDSASKKGLSYATIAALSPQNTIIDGALTKDDGSFNIEGLPLGDYSVKVSFLGYKSIILDGISLTKEKPTMILPNTLLKISSISTSEIEVSAEKPNITYMLDRKVINISDNPSNQGGRLVDALANIPSITVDMEGDITIRGSANFQVLIDGKPSPMSGNDALKSIPADAVQDVELITNPSAKYDPDGTAGIVNIILKKANLNGINGILNTSVGIKDKYSADGLFNYRYEDLNFYAGLSYQNMTFKPSSKMVREQYNATFDTTNYIDPAINRKMTDKNWSGRTGIEYSIDANNFFSISNVYQNLEYNRLMPNKFKVWTNPQTSTEYFINDDDYFIKGFYNTTNAYYSKNFAEEGHKISSTLNAIVWDGNGYEKSSKSLTDSNFNVIDKNPDAHRSDAYSRTFMMKYKIDYENPIWEGYNFEAGYNFDYTQDFSDFLYEDWNKATNVWDKNTLYSNDTKYFHTINTIWATFSGALFDFNYQLGLRGEYFDRRLHQAENNELFTYKKFNLFPTLHISKKFENDQQIQLSYSRRVQRPDVYALNPFPDYADDYVVSVGNPNLMPEFTDSYELNYQKGYENFYFTIQGYYRYTDNAISRVLRTKNDKKLWITSENVANNKTYGAECSANINFSKSFRLSLNCNFYNYKLEVNDATIEENTGGNIFDGNIMLFWSLTSNTLFQLNGFYLGPRYTIDGKIDETYSVGFSVKQFLLDRKMTVFLVGRNVLNTMQFDAVNRRSNFYSYGSNYTEGANLSLGFSLNINNYERKVRPEDEIERTNVGASGGY